MKDKNDIFKSSRGNLERARVGTTNHMRADKDGALEETEVTWRRHGVTYREVTVAVKSNGRFLEL